MVTGARSGNATGLGPRRYQRGSDAGREGRPRAAPLHVQGSPLGLRRTRSSLRMPQTSTSVYTACSPTSRSTRCPRGSTSHRCSAMTWSSDSRTPPRELRRIITHALSDVLGGYKAGYYGDPPPDRAPATSTHIDTRALGQAPVQSSRCGARARRLVPGRRRVASSASRRGPPAISLTFGRTARSRCRS